MRQRIIFIGNAVLPVAMGGNVYLNDAVPSRHEPDAKIYEQKGIKVEINPAQGKVQIQINEPELLRGASADVGHHRPAWQDLSRRYEI